MLKTYDYEYKFKMCLMHNINKKHNNIYNIFLNLNNY